MTNMEYQLNELYKELTGKICTTMDGDAVESMRETLEEIKEEKREQRQIFLDYLTSIDKKIDDGIARVPTDDNLKELSDFTDDMYEYIKIIVAKLC